MLLGRDATSLPERRLYAGNVSFMQPTYAFPDPAKFPAAVQNPAIFPSLACMSYFKKLYGWSSNMLAIPTVKTPNSGWIIDIMNLCTLYLCMLYVVGIL